MFLRKDSAAARLSSAAIDVRSAVIASAIPLSEKLVEHRFRGSRVSEQLLGHHHLGIEGLGGQSIRNHINERIRRRTRTVVWPDL
jgi:hypothetical protein